MKKGNRRITVEISKELHMAVKLHCVRLGMPMTEWLAQIIAEHMKELDDNNE